jgi:isoquinoline 1-oxidoreductase subunit beta
MGIKRRAFLIGSAALVGGGVFGVHWRANSNLSRAAELTAKKGESSFAGWLKIAEDDSITLYVPHTDMGQGAYTGLAQMCLEELDGDWKYVHVEQAPADLSFANGPMVRAFIASGVSLPAFVTGTADAIFGQAARWNTLQITGGSTALRMTGQFGMRVAGAAAREALLASAAEQLKVPVAELSAAKSVITHASSGRSLRYGELAKKAAERSLNHAPTLKNRKQFSLIGTSPARLDIPDKVQGKTVYGIDVQLPDMRVATIQSAPVFGEVLLSVDEAPALAVAGVEKVLRLPDAVIVIARGYWAAKKGLDALSPKFGKGSTNETAENVIHSSEDLFIAQERTLKGELETAIENGDAAVAMKTTGAKKITASYRVPFLHHAAMEPISLTGHFNKGELSVWGSIQDPLTARHIIAKAAGLEVEEVMFYSTPIGGSFGRRFPGTAPQLQQLASIAPQLPYPVKLIWSREEDFTHGAYRPQLTSVIEGAVAGGKVIAWDQACIADRDPSEAAAIPYDIAATRVRYADCPHSFPTGAWRAVDHTQHGFYTECFIDELATAAGIDPFQFRQNHLPADGRHRKVLEAVADKAKWKAPIGNKRARGIAMVEAMGSVAAHVVEVSWDANEQLQIDRVVAVVDCGVVVHPDNAQQQVVGGIIMGLSAALGEQITIQDGAVVQRNFSDYPILRLAQVPTIEVHFIETGAALGGLGEPGLPPVAPALANAVFALTGTRIRTLPLSLAKISPSKTETTKSTES